MQDRQLLYSNPQILRIDSDFEDITSSNLAEKFKYELYIDHCLLR